ncbi:YiiX/YebB-like N1pC/P60 family cysteine hydrolase [uncultured Amaricoccus sp.]|uniref:YiiX/YebB-like N1pC/P60 family cysteine hydrolase n=1 Tax=uncultured Amaricoccus sp. TaxID=339341 RepID=UPI00262F1545|nr:YiiX/YebB-like N1pC/P60 family cysteine hydrolase [uncultured Amaricoccus sp.]
MTEQRDTAMDRLGRYLAARLQDPVPGAEPYTHANVAALREALRPGDVLLVEGVNRLSGAIKYLTQSTWSHAALYVGDALGPGAWLIEANLGEGCVAVPLAKYELYNTRICRPRHLTQRDRAALVDFMMESLGKRYDMKNIFDMLRYFLPRPPVPARWRRQMIAFGSGDPTRAICSSLIADAFQRIRYPILPLITREFRADPMARAQRREILHIRHHSLFAPRDFDLSPYFEIVKPTLEAGFDYRRLTWSDASPPEQPETGG